LSTFTVNNHNYLLCFQQPKAELARNIRWRFWE